VAEQSPVGASTAVTVDVAEGTGEFTQDSTQVWRIG
jgi:hypothetical protein